MLRNVNLVILLLMAASLSACGGGNSSSGNSLGATVTIQPQVKTGTATIKFTQYSSAASQVSFPMMDFTLKSTINSNAGSMASDVSIQSETFTFEYIDSIPVGLGTNLVIPPLSYFSNLNVPAGGTAEWQNVPIMLNAAKQYLKAQAPLSNSTQQIRFKIICTFNGVEVKNGSNISANTTGTLIVSQ